MHAPTTAHRRHTLLVLGLVAVLLAAACGGSESGQAAEESGTAASDQPVDGGTLTFAEFSAPRGLDPLVMSGYGTTGLIESQAVYDTLLRYDAESGEYIPRTAESVTPNADASEWTIVLRPDITFTDGTAYDAEAVVFNLNRQRSGQPGAPPCAEVVACPRNTVQSAYPASFIADVQAVDDLTVEVTLHEAWTGFPAALSAELGLIASPTALKKCSPTAPPAECEFNTHPVGAGPFTVTSFDPAAGITMARNEAYWDGKVHLDGVKFVALGDGGGSKTYDALGTGQVQAAFLRDPAAVKQAHSDGVDGFQDLSFGAAALLLNTRPGTATASLDVRKAVAAAIDQKLIADRVYNGAVPKTTDLVTSEFRWYPGDNGFKHDVAKARSLAAQAKAAGWDGKLRLVTNNTPAAANAGLILQAQLKAVGIDASLDSTRDVAGAQELLVGGQFDAFLGGLGMLNDETAMLGLAKNFSSSSPSNRVGLKDPALDAALTELRTAGGDAERTDAYEKVLGALNAQVPVVSLATFEQYIVWSSEVHGVETGIETSVYFAKAWLSK